MTDKQIVTLDADEREVLDAVRALNAAKRSTNNSQIASRTGLPRNRVNDAANRLYGRHFIRDIGKGAAYNWRVQETVIANVIIAE